MFLKYIHLYKGGEVESLHLIGISGFVNVVGIKESFLSKDALHRDMMWRKEEGD